MSYVLNVSKSDTNIGTVGTMIIDGHSLAMAGTYASFGQLLAIQGQQLLSQLVFGNNFTNVEINMRFNTSLYMVGAIVFTANRQVKTCVSELRRNAGNYFIPFGDAFNMGTLSCFSTILMQGK